MKKILLFLNLIVVGLLTPGKAMAENMIRYQVSYEDDKIIIDTVLGQNGKRYSFIEMGNLYTSRTSTSGGYPCFPGPQQLEFSVPYDATDFILGVNVKAEEDIQLPYPPLPGQPDSFAGGNTNYKYGESDFRELIAPSDFKEEPIAAIESVTRRGGINRVVIVNLNPVRWTLDPKKIKVVKKVELTLRWTLDDTLLESDTIYPGHTRRNVEWTNNQTKRNVVNPEDVEKNSPFYNGKRQHLLGPDRSPLKLKSSIDVSENIPYIIIAPKNLVVHLERLASLRRLRGLETKVISMDDILTDPENDIGDYSSGINDNAGKVRGFLRNVSEANHTKHVLLASRFPEVTGRWVQATPLSPEDTTVIKFISDQYFRDLNTIWPKLTSDGYSELSKLEGMAQNMNVGRVSFLYEDEINSYIDKLIQYEFNIHDSNLSYLDKAFVMLSDDKRFAQEYNNYSNIPYTMNFDKVTMDSIARTKFHTGAEVIDGMKKDNYGFLDLRGHGHYAGITVDGRKANQEYGINALDAYRGLLVEESSNGLDCYKNTQYPSWSLSMSCSLSELGYDRGNTYTFADSYILGKDYGGVVFIGNTNQSLIQGSSALISDIFNEGLKLSASKTLKIPYAGQVLTNGLNIHSSSRLEDKYTKSIITLNGDPLVPLWFRKPSESSKDGLFSPKHLNSTDSLAVGIYDFTTGKATYAHDIFANQRTSTETTNSTKIRYRPDMLPYINPCLISGLVLTKTRYVFTDALRFANDTKANKGALTLTGNSNFTIEAFGKVTMNGIINVLAGSKMSVISYKPIILEDCTITSEGSVNLKSQREVALYSNTQMSKGMKLTIHKAY